jgi:hypothetical protein
MAVRTYRTEIDNRIDTICFSDRPQRNQVMDMDVPIAQFSIPSFEVEAADNAVETVVGDTHGASFPTAFVPVDPNTLESTFIKSGCFGVGNFIGAHKVPQYPIAPFDIQFGRRLDTKARTIRPISLVEIIISDISTSLYRPQKLFHALVRVAAVAIVQVVLMIEIVVAVARESAGREEISVRTQSRDEDLAVLDPAPNSRSPALPLP